MIRRSFVDVLAEQLSMRTGAEFKVHRMRKGTATLYGLRVNRNEFGHGVGPWMKLNDMKALLAGFIDLYSMGFVMLLPPEATLEDHLKVHRHWDAVKAMVALID